MQTPDNLFDRNKKWAQQIKKERPNFFSNLAEGQEPNFLWIGCSDSRVPANQIVDLPPGELFVHRNIANLVVHSDLNFLSVLQYAVEVLEVNHIVVCGHYGCGGVKAATDDKGHGMIDNWLRQIKDVQLDNAEELKGLSGDDEINRLCELNVAQQVKNISTTPIVQNAWENGQNLNVHGWIYSLEQGEISDLELTTSSNDDLG
ncbi:carbonic anhydrase [Fodinibius salinus]|uniref:Carbonic anhydrase n=1 Tax=Fodinibius salinus TaxID=860790 RepID=A0A5D3YG52_9BACT|nr:carbonate dehydratase [Fodinibius salinus]TYP92205.1 carbonic anhydrase [Fodinibius salinus]